ncbi:MAG: hypothetical protein AUK47_08860 [Deltaproteobacteria bacterium CG2_30_63_29]|nr:MAG: hypothetical protein AUK47_08860 [Deltaproteobacteria bacterium CG2_30_63_29]
MPAVDLWTASVQQLNPETGAFPVGVGVGDTTRAVKREAKQVVPIPCGTYSTAPAPSSLRNHDGGRFYWTALIQRLPPRMAADPDEQRVRDV